MNQSNLSPTTVVVGLVFVLAVWGLYAIVEVCEEKAESIWSLEAQRNPYLAAEKFLRQSDIGVVEMEGFANLDSLQDVSTLFVGDSNQVTTSVQLDRVVSWLERGGNVIYSADSWVHDDDLLLESFHIDVDWARDEENSDDEDAEAEEEKQSLSDTMREYNRQIEEGKTREEIVQSISETEFLTTVDFDDGSGELEVAFSAHRVLLHPYVDGSDYDGSIPQPRSWAYSENGVHLLQFEVGDGLLTVISDPGVWTSYRIDSHDHAFLLWKLSASGGSFAILSPVLQDSLWDLTVEHAGELLIAVALLIAVWIWHLGYRFGRLVPRDVSRTRALAEHFSSISHYLWHRRHGEYLIQPLRQRVMRRASLTLGEFALAEPEAQIELLSQRADRTPVSVARAMQETKFSEASFVQTVKLLKHIEQSL